MKYENEIFDAERALYAADGDMVSNCVFAGPADGESALKESKNVKVDNCRFELRYPFWHTKTAQISNCEMTSTCRAALWYDEKISLSNCKMSGIKALRECENVTLERCEISSEEFGWKCTGIKMNDSSLVSVYPFLLSKELEISRLNMKGKYSFQYVENAVLRDCVFDTKDAFWHTKNVTVYDSEIKGEYLGWYSENLTLVRCKIIGTQPLCYCRGLKLVDCETENADLAFEYSDVTACVKGHIDSIKNPHSGEVVCDSVGEIITDENKLPDSSCNIIINN